MNLDRPNDENARLASGHVPTSTQADQALDAFSRSYLVAGLSRDEVVEILKLGRFRRLVAREFLVREGDASADLFVVLKGHLSVMSHEGEKLGEIRDHAVVGEVSLCDAGKRTADVIAVGLVDVIQLPAQALRAHLAAHRDVGFIVLANLAQTLAARLRRANDKIDALLENPRDSWTNAL